MKNIIFLGNDLEIIYKIIPSLEGVTISICKNINEARDSLLKQKPNLILAEFPAEEENLKSFHELSIISDNSPVVFLGNFENLNFRDEIKKIIPHCQFAKYETDAIKSLINGT